ncbi:SPOR domain-containing protein [Aquicoccus sp. SCR17]|nr:SPOR domain-containing protein [Carideicomes alvinocaridis]
MADFRGDYPAAGDEDAGAAQAPRRSFTGLANLAGALVSAALLIGVGVWGYKIVMRDVSGVPVVHAAQGPMRVAPESPGGRPAEHQGLAVNRVAGQGEAEPPAERLLLAPEPMDLADEDRPMQGEAEAKALEGTAEVDVENAEAEEVPGRPVANDVQLASIQQLADQIAAEAEPLSEVSDTAATEGEEDEVSDIAELSEEGDVMASVRPKNRPEGLRETFAAAVITHDMNPTEDEGGIEIEASAIPSGTRLAQLGAFESAEVARQEWERLATRFDAYLEGKKRVIQKASSGGRTFYRLRAYGFRDLSDARRFCAAFVAERQECIPLSTK